jgi:hypothetical protein
MVGLLLIFKTGRLLNIYKLIDVRNALFTFIWYNLMLWTQA